MPQLQFTLADFQIVHPTETESYVARRENVWDAKTNQPAWENIMGTRAKRLSVPGVKIILKAPGGDNKPKEHTFTTDETGRAIFSVAQADLPQLPQEAEFEFITPKGQRERGKVRVGGNEHAFTKEVVLAQ
jgi:hypothetical protein